MMKDINFKKLTIEQQMEIHHEGINIAVARTDDGKTCLLCDRELPVQPVMIGFYTEDATVRLIYDEENIYGKDLSYPLQYDIVELWQKQGETYFAYILDGEVSNILKLPVVFIDEKP